METLIPHYLRWPQVLFDAVADNVCVGTTWVRPAGTPVTVVRSWQGRRLVKTADDPPRYGWVDVDALNDQPG